MKVDAMVVMVGVIQGGCCGGRGFPWPLHPMQVPMVVKMSHATR